MTLYRWVAADRTAVGADGVGANATAQIELDIWRPVVGGPSLNGHTKAPMAARNQIAPSEEKHWGGWIEAELPRAVDRLSSTR